MKKITHVSDITGNDIKDHVQLGIKRADHALKIGNNTYFGDTVLDIDVSELSGLLNNVSFIKNVHPSIAMPMGVPQAASAAFFGPGGHCAPEPKKVSVARRGEAPEGSVLTEIP